MYTALEEAGYIVDSMFSCGTKSFRVKVDLENQFIIAELQAVCQSYPGMLEWSVLGSINTGIAYFTLHNKYNGGPDGPGGKVIQGNFRKRRRARKAA